MLRITQVNEDSGQVCLKVEGRVIGDWISELDRTCGSCLSQNRPITLDLSDVTYIDRQGVETLKRVLGEKVQLKGMTLLVLALLGQQVLGKIRHREDNRARRTADQGGEPHESQARSKTPISTGKKRYIVPRERKTSWISPSYYSRS